MSQSGLKDEIHLKRHILQFQTDQKQPLSFITDCSGLRSLPEIPDYASKYPTATNPFKTGIKM